jgi:hypothetical protein
MGIRKPRAWLSLALVALGVCGCASPERAAVVTYGPNLVLGRSHGLSAAAQQWAGRSDWPSVEWGYVLEDVTFYRRDAYDGQLLFDRYNSSYFINDSTRSGILVR